MSDTITTQPSQDRGEWTSASNAAADRACPGRHLAQRGIPENKTDDAEHGRVIHAALAKRDPAGLTLEQQEIYDACLEIETKVVTQFFGITAEELAASKPMSEQRFWIHWKDELRHSGQIDRAHKKGTKALIIEWKTLAGEVAGSSRNIQLRDQACLFDHNNAMLAEIGTVVIQPLVTHKPEICVYKREHLVQAMKEMHDRVAASNDPNSKRVPGNLQCKYCRAAAAGKCQEYNAWAGATVTVDPHLLDTPSKDWTPTQCAIFCERQAIAQKWLDDCKAAMKERLKADENAIPGWKLKPGNKRETITNPQAVFDCFSQRGGTLTQFMGCIEVGKGALKEAVAAVTKSKGKKLDAELSAVIGENHIISQNEPSLAKEKE